MLKLRVPCLAQTLTYSIKVGHAQATRSLFGSNVDLFNQGGTGSSYAQAMVLRTTPINCVYRVGGLRHVVIRRWKAASVDLYVLRKPVSSVGAGLAVEV